MTEADIIYKPVWFLYDIGLRHERIKDIRLCVRSQQKTQYQFEVTKIKCLSKV